MEASRLTPRPRLTVELVPKTCWFSNVRSVLDKPGWDQVRRKVYRQCGYACEICGGRGHKHPVEAHEIWTYHDTTHTQILSGMVGLCPDCHEVKHLGYAATRGREEAALNHLMRINGWTAQQTIDYAERAFEVWAERSRYAWTLDLRGLRPYVTVAVYQAACAADHERPVRDVKAQSPDAPGGVVVIDLGPPDPPLPESAERVFLRVDLPEDLEEWAYDHPAELVAPFLDAASFDVDLNALLHEEMACLNGPVLYDLVCTIARQDPTRRPVAMGDVWYYLVDHDLLWDRDLKLQPWVAMMDVLMELIAAGEVDCAINLRTPLPSRRLPP